MNISSCVCTGRPDLIMTVKGADGVAQTAMIGQFKKPRGRGSHETELLRGLAEHPLPPAYTNGVHVVVTMVDDDEARIWIYDVFNFQPNLFKKAWEVFYEHIPSPPPTPFEPNKAFFSYNLAQAKGYDLFLCHLPKIIQTLSGGSHTPFRLLHRFGSTIKIENMVYKYCKGFYYSLAERHQAIRWYQNSMVSSTMAQTDVLSTALVVDTTTTTTTGTVSSSNNTPRLAISDIHSTRRRRLDCYFLTAFPYVEGQRLYPNLLNHQETVIIFDQVYSWYEEDFFHNDIRSPNIIIGTDGKLHIIDFEHCSGGSSYEFIDILDQLVLWKKFKEQYFNNKNNESLEKYQFPSLVLLAFNVWCLILSSCFQFHLAQRDTSIHSDLKELFKKVINSLEDKDECLQVVEQIRTFLVESNENTNPQSITQLINDFSSSSLDFYPFQSSDY